MARLQAFDDLIARVWHDTRMTPGARDLISAMAWTLERDPQRPTGRDYWNKIGRLLGRERLDWRYKELIADDTPRYEPPNTWHTRACEAPRIRTTGTCGAPPKWDLHLVERDPLTGWHIDRSFCNRHRDHYDRVKAQLAAAPEAPEPIPNTGGLIGCYFKCDLERLYAKFAPYWKTPVYGLCADDWPVPGQDAARLRKPRLRLIIGELVDA